jgi:hypothetical protein
MRQDIEQLPAERRVGRSVGIEARGPERKPAVDERHRLERGRLLHQLLEGGIAEELMSRANQPSVRARGRKECLRLFRCFHERLLDVDMRSGQQRLPRRRDVCPRRRADMNEIRSRLLQ